MFIRLLLISLALFTVQVYAADDGDWWLQREIQLQQNREDYAKRVYGRSASSFLETDAATGRSKTITKIAIAEATPTASKVGSTMLQRVAFYARNPGVQMVGVMAVSQLIEAIGWVMTDGAYVKFKQPDPDQPLDLSKFKYYPIGESTGSLADIETRKQELKAIYPNGNSSTFRNEFDSFNWGKTSYSIENTRITVVLTVNTKFCTENCSPSPDYTYGDPSRTSIFTLHGVYTGESPKPEKIELTPELLGAAMMGQGYNDPVDPAKYNPIANTGYMNQSVASAYEHSNGVGEDLANQMDNKLRNAPLTPDGQPAPFGDPRYGSSPSDSNKNDRSWRTDGATATGSVGSGTGTGTGSGTGTGTGTGSGTGSGTGTGTGTGSGSGSTDPQTKPQSISITFPNFCEWAFTVCKWYDDWKVTDKWMKDTPELKDEKLEVENEDIETYHRQDSVVFGKTCPFSPERVSIPMGLVGSIDFDKDLTFFCTYGEQAAPYIQGLGYLGSLIFLMLGLRNGNA
ncbi:hypothetical protein ACG91E_13175 [Acinetobacter nosocomialis]|uniref:hypothetical protein n=1 Tax=Acinetobacter nosocomialis TaxID=106654 RepID=UPI003AF41036